LIRDPLAVYQPGLPWSCSLGLRGTGIIFQPLLEALGAVSAPTWYSLSGGVAYESTPRVSSSFVRTAHAGPYVCWVESFPGLWPFHWPRRLRRGLLESFRCCSFAATVIHAHPHPQPNAACALDRCAAARNADRTTKQKYGGGHALQSRYQTGTGVCDMAGRVWSHPADPTRVGADC